MDHKDSSIRCVVKFLREKGYRRVHHLGTGGFGSVLSAVSPNQEPVAIKIIENKNRWHIEERIWPLLRHKNILPLYEMIEMENFNLKLFVMPQEPNALHKILPSRNFLGDKHGLFRVKCWLMDILDGLQYLHSLGYAHLDLKTDNILIASDDRALICDFSGLNVTKVPLRR